MGKRIKRILGIVTFWTLLMIFSSAAVLFVVLMPKDIESWKVLLTMDNIALIIGIVPSVYLMKVIFSSGSSTSVNSDPSFGLRTLFLWIFALGVIVDEFIHAMIDIQCLFSKGHFDLNFIDPTALRTFSIVCIVLQLLIITKGNRRQLTLTWKIEISIYLIIFLHVDFWLKGTVEDIGNMYIKNAFIHSYNVSNRSDDIKSRACFWESDYQNFLAVLLPYTMPMRFEFHMLAIVLLLKLGVIPMCTNSNQNMVRPTEENHGKRRYTIGTLCIGIMAAVIFGSLRFLSKFYSGNPSNEAIVTNTFLAFLSAFNLFLFVLVMGCFYIWSRKYFPSQYKDLMINELVIVITGMFPILYYVTVIFDSKKNCNTSLRIFASCTALTIIFYQTIFIICSNCYQMFTKPSYGEKCFLKLSFISLGLGNMIYWGINTFTEMRDPADWIINNDKNWNVFHRFIDTLCTYYRFHISMEFYAQFEGLR